MVCCGRAVSTVGRMVLQKAKHSSQASKSVGRAAYSIPPWLTATSVFASREQHRVQPRVVFLSKRRKKAGNACVPNSVPLVKRFSILWVLISCFCRAVSPFPLRPLCLFPAWLRRESPQNFHGFSSTFFPTFPHPVPLITRSLRAPGAVGPSSAQGRPVALEGQWKTMQ